MRVALSQTARRDRVTVGREGKAGMHTVLHHAVFYNLQVTCKSRVSSSDQRTEGAPNGII